MQGWPISPIKHQSPPTTNMADKYFSTPQNPKSEKRILCCYFTFNFNLNQVHTFTYIRELSKKTAAKNPTLARYLFWTASPGEYSFMSNSISSKDTVSACYKCILAIFILCPHSTGQHLISVFDTRPSRA